MAGQKLVSRGVRLTEQQHRQIEKAWKERGYATPSAFMREAIDRELGSRGDDAGGAEERIAATLDRLAREIRGIRLGQQAQFAFNDALVKAFLTCVPEPPREVYDQAVARAKGRYDRFLKSVGMGMTGDSQAAMAELLKRGDEE